MWLTVICKATYNSNVLLFTGNKESIYSVDQVQWGHSLLHWVDKGVEKTHDLDPGNICVSAPSWGELSELGNIEHS